VTFAEAARVDEAKADRQEIVAFLKVPKGYGRQDAKGGPAGWAAGHRQNADRQGGRG